MLNSVQQTDDEKRRNPPWVRDEVILALELYFRVHPNTTNSDHPQILELSELLKRLPVHPAEERKSSFRNPDGVYMKLCNFLPHDPNYPGVGLGSGSKLDKEIWSEFSDDKPRLIEIANAIRRNVASLSGSTSAQLEQTLSDEDAEFQEGRVLTRLHKFRERDPKAVRRKKQQVLNKTGKLVCEACEFDFSEKYPQLGNGFIEAHHTKPISTLDGSQKTKLEDLALLCANCHRMIHLSRPMLSVDALKALIVE